MAAINGFPLHAPNNDQWIISGSFAPNGGSAIASTSKLGKGWTVARTSAGVITVTFNDKWNDLLDAQVSLQQTVLTDALVRVGLYTASTRTLVINCSTIALPTTLADIAAVANTRINFKVMFRNSAVTPTYG